METKRDALYWQDLQDKLSQALVLVGPALSASGYFLAREFPASLSVMQEQIDIGEEEYVFALLCEVLQEHKVPISPAAYALIKDVGTMAADYWANHPGDYTPNYPPEMWEELKPQVMATLFNSPAS